MRATTKRCFMGAIKIFSLVHWGGWWINSIGRECLQTFDLVKKFILQSIGFLHLPIIGEWSSQSVDTILEPGWRLVFLTLDIDSSILF
jgi:hypothetical protein